MRKIIAHEWISLDGVVQAPSYADEDPDGGCAHDGNHAPLNPFTTSITQPSMHC